MNVPLVTLPHIGRGLVPICLATILGACGSGTSDSCAPIGTYTPSVTRSADPGDCPATLEDLQFRPEDIVVNDNTVCGTEVMQDTGYSGTCSYQGTVTATASQSGIVAHATYTFQNCSPGVSKCTANYDVTYSLAGSEGGLDAGPDSVFGSVDSRDGAADVVGEDGTVGSDGGYEIGTYLCQVNADGTCSAVTPDTSCLPVKGTLYDQEANFISNIGGTLYCTAWQTDAPGGLAGGLAPSVGCLLVPQDGGTLIYRTAESDISNPWWRSHECDLSLTALVLDAAGCGSSSTDGPLSSSDTVPSDAVTPAFCNLNDGRQIPARAAYAADDKCNCCVCTSSGTGICQAAGLRAWLLA